MRTYRDAKTMAKVLRKALSEQNIETSHSFCLELVARQFGFADWNALAARIDDLRVPLEVPAGWQPSGSRSNAYDMGIDQTEPHRAALIRCKYEPDDPAALSIGDGFGTLMQSMMAKSYRGKRLRFSAKLKTVDAGGGTLWMRVDGKQHGTLRFDNMERRKIEGVLSGTTDWCTRSIVLEIPKSAEIISFGFYLRGTGSLWVRDVELAEAADELEATNGAPLDRMAPVNLGFQASL